MSSEGCMCNTKSKPWSWSSFLKREKNKVPYTVKTYIIVNIRSEFIRDFHRSIQQFVLNQFFWRLSHHSGDYFLSNPFSKCFEFVFQWMKNWFVAIVATTARLYFGKRYMLKLHIETKNWTFGAIDVLLFRTFCRNDQNTYSSVWPNFHHRGMWLVVLQTDEI